MPIIETIGTELRTTVLEVRHRRKSYDPFSRMNHDMTSDEDVAAALDEITIHSLSRGKPALGRIATIQAMVDLGDRWQNHNEIQKAMKKYTSTGGDYMFDLARRYPLVLEKNNENLVRIRPEVFKAVAGYVPTCLQKLRDATSSWSHGK